MVKLIKRYTRWLHTRWPAGQVEKLPVVRGDYSTNVSGLFITGDLTGVPLLKLSADSGAAVVQSIVNDPSFKPGADGGETLDLAIVGAGVSGFSAALEAHHNGLAFRLYEATEPFSTIVNFPKAKPIYTYPTDMTPSGELQFHEKSGVKEGLLEDLEEQTLERGIEPVNVRVEKVERSGGLLHVHRADGSVDKAKRVIVAIGRSGNFRKLNVPGEEKDKVYNRLHDPADFCGQNILVVGGGDSAMETAIALATCGADVTLSYRKPEFSRPKPDNIEKINALARGADRDVDVDVDVDVETVEGDRVTTPSGGYQGEERRRGSLSLMMSSNVKAIRDDEVDVEDADGQTRTLANDTVFAMIGREPPLDFFRRSGVQLSGEWNLRNAIGPALFLLLCFWVYTWTKTVPYIGQLPDWLSPDPSTISEGLKSIGGTVGAWLNDPATLVGTIVAGLAKPAFYYTLAYSLLVVIFGVKRIRRRKTPYVKVQTLTLMAIQVVPLFILPVILLPWLAANGAFDAGVGAWIETQFFPNESWWRAYGLILAWPLMVWNWFTAEPIWGWLVLGAIQTFVLIPLVIRYWGKGAYCGWICSCGAMAETFGDTQRHKMPHGPFWNRLNMTGQVILAIAALLMVFRVIGWSLPDPDNWAAEMFNWAHTAGVSGATGGAAGALSYNWLVDVFLAGMLGYGLYFFMSGRVWCRFACPLAALMHIYARFSRFRILADKKKCISCNVCTSVCHQGIDIMNFANKGLPMADPECVRCSACVQMCPTGVLEFGQVNPKTGAVIAKDPQWLAASPVRMAELTVKGKKTE